MFKEPFTNQHPRKYIPSSSTPFLKDVQNGKETINPPVKTPGRFRGKIIYAKDICIGCKLCLKVYPSQVIVFKEEEMKIKVHLACCTFAHSATISARCIVFR